MKISNLTVAHEPMGSGRVLVARWLKDGEPQSLATTASRTVEGEEKVEKAFMAEMEIKLGLKSAPEETELFKNAMAYQNGWIDARR